MTQLISLKGVTRRFTSQPTFTERLARRFTGAKSGATVVHAVEDVSLHVGRGETLGLVGESGCGKSTLGRIAAGILQPTAGSAEIDGVPVMQHGRKRTTRVQMVFQDPFASLNPRMRVGDTISEGPRAHGLVSRDGAQSDVIRWLAAVGLDAEAAQRFPHQFSGGQRQRVAIARALAMHPDALICDEPVASLDVSIQAQIINLFLQLRRDLNLTMLFISHDLSVVRHVSDRIAVMYLGRIVETGRTEAVFNAPAHPYTRALLDSAPRLAADGAPAQDIHPIRGELPSPIHPPPGCSFHQRCAFAQESCKQELPLLRPAGEQREVACHFPLR
ncbi:ABC transporter ATP-binding protein [uncultured Ramlibacter sp.]|uniref:ABC transporter ATP-binding protein n=1 Tax=uncultured Ramlibacter sp. TaxID=260755 RepID=UPI00261669E2|nr:oligopeptide/dipeptide ABC transporter ATP-binding protein [uncultured Ramlibacter sp.]